MEKSSGHAYDKQTSLLLGSQGDTILDTVVLQGRCITPAGFCSSGVGCRFPRFRFASPPAINHRPFRTPEQKLKGGKVGEGDRTFFLSILHTTTGFDDIHLRKNAYVDNPEIVIVFEKRNTCKELI